LYCRLGGPHVQSLCIWKILPLPESDSWAVLSAASYYTKCANMAHKTKSK
jgi:hypothetical protein